MSRTSPLKRLEIKFSGLRKCQTAVLPYFAYLARNPQPDYSLKFGGYKSPGKTYQPSSGPDFAALGFSQQYESQQDVADDKIFYVKGSWRCNFFFRMEATQRDLQHEWTSAEIRGYSSASPQRHKAVTSTAHLPGPFCPQAAL